MINQVSNVNLFPMERFFGKEQAAGPDLQKLLFSFLDYNSISNLELSSRIFKIYIFENSYWEELCKTIKPAPCPPLLELIDKREGRAF